METLKPVYLPMGRTTFHMESATDYYNRSCKVIKELAPGAEMPQELLTDLDMLNNYLDEIKNKDIDIAVVQSTTFVDATFTIEIVRKLSCPVLVWCVREPVIDGSRLRLNSLTGGFAAGNTLSTFGRTFDFVFGNPEEEQVQKKLSAYFKAASVVKGLKNLTLGVVGNVPPGFFFGEELSMNLLNVIGTKLERLDLNSLIQEAKELKTGEYEEALAELKEKIFGIEEIEEEQVDKNARFRTVLKKHVEEKGIKAIASRCWPTVFQEYNAAICATLSLFTEEGIVSSCEADIGGAISMYIQKQITGEPPYFGDPVSLDEEKNSIIYWHCGAGACSLARTDTGARAGRHPNRKLGLSLEFGLKDGRVTVCRFGKGPNGYRLFIMAGEALDEPQKFLGTSVEVRPDGNAAEIVNSAINEGWEPHFSVVYGDITEELKAVAKLLNIEVVEY
ncbi:MAG: hypothetical protein PWQ96_1706 [Clostridia bacterium]|nr:hypothetical protein [Clostridia bacterium]